MEGEIKAFSDQIAATTKNLYEAMKEYANSQQKAIKWLPHENNDGQRSFKIMVGQPYGINATAIISDTGDKYKYVEKSGMHDINTIITFNHGRHTMTIRNGKNQALIDLSLIRTTRALDHIEYVIGDMVSDASSINIKPGRKQPVTVSPAPIVNRLTKPVPIKLPTKIPSLSTLKAVLKNLIDYIINNQPTDTKWAIVGCGYLDDQYAAPDLFIGEKESHYDRIRRLVEFEIPSKFGSGSMGVHIGKEIYPYLRGTLEPDVEVGYTKSVGSSGYLYLSLGNDTFYVNLFVPRAIEIIEQIEGQMRVLAEMVPRQ